RLALELGQRFRGAASKAQLPAVGAVAQRLAQALRRIRFGIDEQDSDHANLLRLPATPGDAAAPVCAISGRADLIWIKPACGEGKERRLRPLRRASKSMPLGLDTRPDAAGLHLGDLADCLHGPGGAVRYACGSCNQASGRCKWTGILKRACHEQNTHPLRPRVCARSGSAVLVCDSATAHRRLWLFFTWLRKARPRA